MNRDEMFSDYLKTLSDAKKVYLSVNEEAMQLEKQIFDMIYEMIPIYYSNNPTGIKSEQMHMSDIDMEKNINLNDKEIFSYNAGLKKAQWQLTKAMLAMECKCNDDMTDRIKILLRFIYDEIEKEMK